MERYKLITLLLSDTDFDHILEALGNLTTRTDLPAEERERIAILRKRLAEALGRSNVT